MKILITGAGGMLGRAVSEVFKKNGEDFVGLAHQELEVTREREIQEAFSSYHPEVVIHLAAWTDVDGCEREPEKAFQINSQGTENLAKFCRRYKAKLIYFSTDFVFDGEKKSPYIEDDKPHPLNVYGRSKLAGEEVVKKYLKDYYIIRTSWLFGPGRDNFVTKVLSRLEDRKPLRIVDDQIGTPTYSPDLAAGLSRLLKTASAGIYHLTNSGLASRYEWARVILEYSGRKAELLPVSQSDFPVVAPRPSFSALISRRLDWKLPSWREATREYLSACGYSGRA